MTTQLAQAGKAAKAALELRAEVVTGLEARRVVAKALEALDDALTATKTIVMGRGEGAYLERIPDYALRLEAAKEVFKMLGVQRVKATPSAVAFDPDKFKGKTVDELKFYRMNGRWPEPDCKSQDASGEGE